MKKIALFFIFYFVSGLLDIAILYAQKPYTDRYPCSIVPNTGLSFDWKTQNFTVYLLRYALTDPNGFSLPSPFYARNTQAGNENVNHLDLATTTWRDFEPDEGWVFVQKDFGGPSRFINHPYFILYNKYSGTLRLFIAISEVQGGGYSRAKINLKLTDISFKTALLDLYSEKNYQNALDEFIEPKEITLANKYVADLPEWMFADFAMNYDPCTCNSYSQLYFEVELIVSSTIKITTVGSIDQVLDDAGRENNQGRGKLAFKLREIITGGKRLLDDAVAGYESAQEGLNKVKEWFGLDTSGKLVKLAEKLVPGVGQIFGVTSYILGLFSTPEKPKPLKFKANLESTGEMQIAAPHADGNLDVPGSHIVTGAIIDYKNVMGIFNLIKKPKVYYSLYPDELYPFLMRKRYKFEEIKYVVNPASDLKSSPEIEGGIIFEYFADISTYPNVNSGVVLESDSVLRTPYMPINCLRQHICNPNPYLPIPQYIWLKLFVKLQSDDETQESLFIGKFPITLEQSPQSFGQFGSFTGIPENIDLIENGTITGYFTALDDITIRGNTVLSINDASFTAGDAITVFPNTTIFPNTQMKIGIYDLCNSSIPQTNEGEVDAFCNDATYKTPRQFYLVAKTDLKESKSEEGELNYEDNFNSLIAYPNPATGQSTIRYGLAEKGRVSIYLSNMLGEKLVVLVKGEQREAGVYEVSLDSSRLPAGLYFYTLETETTRITKRLMKTP